jgi:DNA modification methylase
MKARTHQRLQVPQAVIQAVLGQDKVDEPPHNLYKYPARFAPAFAREVIKAFSAEGDLVLDPFCGGGTTLLEAMIAQRRAAGMDVSSLATFVARTKTTPISVHDRYALDAWLDCLESDEPVLMPRTTLFSLEESEHYERNIPTSAKTFFTWAIDRVALLPKPRQQAFARLVLLSIGQWALDCKTSVPTPRELKSEFSARLRAATQSHLQFLSSAAQANGLPRHRLKSLRRIINRDAQGSEDERRIPASWLPAKLVVTSPPYPGVHVVYHRWQVNGRKETPAPFWLANQRDGAGASFYMLGGREETGLRTYFTRLQAVFASVRSLLSDDALVFQLVAFSKPSWQLASFLRAMEQAGFSEISVDSRANCVIDGRIWRHVPGRKWYAIKQGKIPASKEVLLIHRPLPIAAAQTVTARPPSGGSALMRPG